MMSERHFLSEEEWANLLQGIDRGNVIPVIGPGLATIEDTAGQPVLLEQHLAPTFANKLGLENETSFASFGDVARAYLARGEDRKKARNTLFYFLGKLFDDLKEPPSRVLVALGSIPKFNYFIATTADPLLASAIRKAREAPVVYRFHPAGQGAARPGQKNPVGDVPKLDQIDAPLVYHIFGDSKSTDWALVDEDYMEFICGLLQSKKQNTLENLFALLKDRDLLVLGVPAEDWIVRFFLRATREGRLSECNSGYVVDQPAKLGGPLISFIKKSVRSTLVIEGSPVEFASELATRCRIAQGLPPEPESKFHRYQPKNIPRGAVFLSYSRNDLKKALEVAEALDRLNVPVWFDQQQLGSGESFDVTIPAFVKDGCSYFVALISKSTESEPGCYAQIERNWAAQKYQPGMGAFYLPLIVDDTARPARGGPACFTSLHQDTFDHLDEFAQRVAQLYRELKDTGKRPIR